MALFAHGGIFLKNHMINKTLSQNFILFQFEHVNEVWISHVLCVKALLAGLYPTSEISEKNVST